MNDFFDRFSTKVSVAAGHAGAETTMTLNPLQFKYETRSYMDETNWSERDPIHRVIAKTSGKEIGNLFWNKNGIRSVGVDDDYQRQGVATAMWNEGHRLAATHRNIPEPKHSAERTDVGDAWARSVGGRLPRRKDG